MIRQELKKMAQKKFLTKQQLELLLKLPEERLATVCSTFMADIFQLSTEHLERLVRNAAEKKKFERALKDIKRKLEQTNMTGIENALLYQFSKFFGHVEFKKNDTAFVKHALSFLITRLIIPSIQMIRDYEKEGIPLEKEIAVLKAVLKEL